MAQRKEGKPNPVAAFFGFGLTGSTAEGQQPKKARTAAPVPPRQGRGVEGAASAPVAAHSFSGHFITLAIVLAIIAVSIYGPLSSFIRQQNEINGVKASIAGLEEQQGDLEAQISWWQDDNYVKQQARSRLFYVQPGQTPYLVVGADQSSSLIDDTSAAAKTAPEDSWTTKLWGSLQLSAEEPTDSASPSASPAATDEPTQTQAPGSGQ